MTSRERLLTVLAGKVPDCVPVAPDFSNMIPARLTGKPFWDLYLFNDPPIWEAYIQCAKHFDIDSLMDGYFPLTFPGESPQDPTVERFIVRRDGERIVVQGSRRENGRRVWDSTVDVYYVADPPTARVPTAKLGLPPVPNRFEPLEGVKPVDTGPAGLKRVMETMGDQGLVGVWGGAGTLALDLADGVFDYYDNPKKYERLAEERVRTLERRMARILALETRPDFICLGGSGSLVFQTPEILRKLALPAVKRGAEIARQAGHRVALTLSDSFCVDRFRGEFIDLMRRGLVDTLFANTDEVLSLYQTTHFAEAIDAVRREGVLAIVTRSEKGSIVVDGHRTHEVPAFPVARVVDTTGAGDMFSAGFLAGLANGADLETCARLGALAAAEIIQHLGARPLVSLATLARENDLAA